MLVKDKARIRAEEVLSDLWSGTYPVDPVELANSIGISVDIADFEDPDIAGAIIAEEGSLPKIYLSASDSSKRQVFTCAHELGHYYERLDAKQHAYGFIETRGGGSHDLHELYADEFAGNLLMPSAEFRRLMATDLSLDEVAQYFGVSQMAVEKRIEKLLVRASVG